MKFLRTLFRKCGIDVIRPDSVKPKHGKHPLASILNPIMGMFNLVMVKYQIVEGKNAFSDMKVFLGNVDQPLVFDVGANTGQSVGRFRKRFPDVIMHSFEPHPTTFQKLQNNCQGLASVTPWNFGLGSEEGVLQLQENSLPGMNSVLKPGSTAFGVFDGQMDVQIRTLDSFAEQESIEFIHVLKSDAQGYDFEVLKGTQRLMDENKIGMVYFEFIFSDMYKDIPAFDEVFLFLTQNNFKLVSFYKPHYQNELVSWLDVLFINTEYYLSRDPFYDLTPDMTNVDV